MQIHHNNIAKRIYYNLLRKISYYLSKKKATFPAKYKVVSFTFDDFPVTALENGTEILEAYNAHGTFYAALGIADTEQACGKIPMQNDMISLSKRGHEVACHTFNHMECVLKSSDKIIYNCSLNQKTAKKYADISLKNFAYPFGKYDPMSKSIICNIYDSARSIDPGINVGEIDLALLKSVPLYEKYGWTNASRWLERLDRQGGWLIFYTHDVRDAPSPFGCSIELFEKTLELCRNNGYEISTIRQSILLTNQDNS